MREETNNEPEWNKDFATICNMRKLRADQHIIRVNRLLTSPTLAETFPTSLA